MRVYFATHKDASKAVREPGCVGCGYPIKTNHRYCNQCRHFGNIAARIEFHLRVGFISEDVG